MKTLKLMNKKKDVVFVFVRNYKPFRFICTLKLIAY